MQNQNRRFTENSFMKMIGYNCGANESYRARVFKTRSTNKTKIAEDKTIIAREMRRFIYV